MSLLIAELRTKCKEQEKEIDLLYSALNEMCKRFDIQPFILNSNNQHFDKQSKEKRWIILGTFNFN